MKENQTYIAINIISGWWFGPWLLFSINFQRIYGGYPSHFLKSIIFQRGRYYFPLALLVDPTDSASVRDFDSRFDLVPPFELPFESNLPPPMEDAMMAPMEDSFRPLDDFLIKAAFKITKNDPSS